MAMQHMLALLEPSKAVQHRLLNPPPISTPPSNARAPNIWGSIQSGNILAADSGLWFGSSPLSYTYQWYRDGGPIPGATNPTYLCTTADEFANISMTVTVTNAAGSVSASSPVYSTILVDEGDVVLTDENDVPLAAL